MPEMPTDLMGYDRAITVFSPDGRLLQVEYAKTTVNRGTPAVGIVTKEGVVIIADKLMMGGLVVSESVEKLFQIDLHIGAAVSGLTSDGRVLVQKAQEFAQQNMLLYDGPIDTLTLTRQVGDFLQVYTQYAGIRPFGASLLIGGVDKKGARLFLADPSGVFFEYKATVLGQGSEVGTKLLEKEYKSDMSLKEGTILGLKVLKKILGSKFEIDRVDAATIKKKDEKYSKISKEEMKNYAKEV